MFAPFRSSCSLREPPLKIIIKKKGYRCERCDHTWAPIGDEEPKVCPKCKSPYWNKPRNKKV